MKIRLDFGDSVFSLPREKLLLNLPSADGFSLKVLLLLASDDALRADHEIGRAEVCRRLDCTASAFDKALAYWQSCGVLTAVQTAVHDAGQTVSAPAVSAPPLSVPSAAADPVSPDQERQTLLSAQSSAPSPGGKEERRTLQSPSLPGYTESEAARIIQDSDELKDVIDMCQQIIGKIFTPAEVSVLVGLYDHLRLDGEYIATLCAWCRDNGKHSLRYIEKTALGLFDEGIDSSAALTAYIRQKESCRESLAVIRKLIGAGTRELTAKEKKTFECWLNDWKFDIGVITRAFEVTVDKISEPSVPYMNKVLENWHNAGLSTLEAVEASLENYKKKKAEAETAKSGFETDEFFEAALRRSFQNGDGTDGNP